MTNEVLFAGGRLDSVSVVSGAPTETTSSTPYDSSYSDCAISCTSSDVVACTFVVVSGGVLAGSDVVSGETVWAHFNDYLTATTGSGAANFAQLYDSSGFPWLALRWTATATMGLYYNSNTGASPTWTQIGSSFTFAATTRYAMDIKLTIGSPHSAEWYVDGVLKASGTFTQASLTTLRALRLSGHHTANNNQFSQILVTRGINTVNAKVKTIRATGAGTNTAWTGAYTDVNEAINSDATLNSATSSGLKQTYAMADVTVPAGYVIQSVFHWLRAKNTGSSPANIDSVVRSSGTDYVSSDLAGISTSFGSIGLRYDTDPATSAAWTSSGFNAAEFGFKSNT